MTTSHSAKMTSYFRRSLIDAENQCPDNKAISEALGIAKTRKSKQAYIALNHSHWEAGTLPQEVAQHILQSKPQQEIAIFPRVDTLINKNSSQNQYFVPLGINVVLHQDGSLKPSQQEPWVPRIWLAPSQSNNETFAELAMVEHFLKQNPFNGIETWEQLKTYCTQMLHKVVQTEPSKDATIFNCPLHPKYKPHPQGLIQCETDIKGASANILKVLDILAETKVHPPLYKRYCDLKDVSLQVCHNIERQAEQALQHIGQMTGEFPLAPKQRNALHYLLKQKDGNMLAVNGPPGTGKTTLLRSVVANMWTQAALQQKEPPLIVATSNNNQAVTNILESFAQVDESDISSELQGRWLPEVNSYGLYCCSSSKAKQTEYMFTAPGGAGCMSEWQDQSYISKAEPHFLKKVSTWHRSKVSSVKKAMALLHKALKERTKAIQQGIQHFEKFKAAHTNIKKNFGSVTKLEEAISQQDKDLKQKVLVYQQAKQKLEHCFQQWDQRSLATRLFLWLPFVQKAEQRKNDLLIQQWDLHLDCASDANIEAWCKQNITRTHSAKTQSENTLQTMRHELKQYQETLTQLQSWMHNQAPKSQGFTQDIHKLQERLTQILDCQLRFQSFKLATHYWEARWLSEMKTFIQNNDDDKKSPKKTLRKLRRFAKLTPCFVSTFFMLPNMFTAGEYQDKTWKDTPLFSSIDLLIVDEAGQALPEVSAASFSLAKQALVVGDTDQIEPVWSVPSSVDKANLEHLNLVTQKHTYEDYWLKSGLLASSGNIMRVAQRQCSFQQFESLQRGLYLTEHRRCFDSIISYCNDLIYKGVLEPKRGEPETSPALWKSPLAMIATASPSQAQSGSRINRDEAEQIAAWVAKHKGEIIAYAKEQNTQKYTSDTDEYILKDFLGIITPFSKQAFVIQTALHQHGIRGLTVGTVHSLQGAERGIVLFSSVYGTNDQGGNKFYDRGKNMLNVAVSRAKDAFIVFGNTDVFGTDSSNTPSSLLRKSLKLL